MERLKSFLSNAGTNAESIMTLKELAEKNFNTLGIYPDSINAHADALFFMVKDGTKKHLGIYGDIARYHEFKGSESSFQSKKLKLCSVDNENCEVLSDLFAFMKPVSHQGKDITIGLGDRLGLASPGHIRLIKNKTVFPVLAQQSIRELNLTGRTYHDVLSAAAWAVFQEGFQSGFGADGDHLKTAEEVKMALGFGFTMITLDCSEHIDNQAASFTQGETNTAYLSLPKEEREYLEGKYLGREFNLKSGKVLSFNDDVFKKTVLVYYKAIQYTIDIYNKVIKPCGKSIDFEMSIDETLTSTTPEAHFFTASELIAGGVDITSLAPRFCGEFQKGIDYIGDQDQFAKEFRIHVKIAEHYGYKISVHSGSDKFSVFPIIGEESKGKYHLKTAGTNWLEAVRVIAQIHPALYRSMHRFALDNLNTAKQYYHIGADPQKIPDITQLNDAEMPSLMDQNDARQVLHITYGLILMAENANGSKVFSHELMETLIHHEELYYQHLYRHIGRHLSGLKLNNPNSLANQ